MSHRSSVQIMLASSGRLMAGAALALSGCTSAAPTPTGLASDSGISEVAGDVGVVLDPQGCEAVAEKPPKDSICVHSVHARLVDDTGAPIVGMIATACGLVCTWGESDAKGELVIEPRKWMWTAALVLPGKSRVASAYFALSPGANDFGTIVLPRIPDGGAMIPRDGTAADLTHGDVTLSVPAAVDLYIDAIALETPEQQRFRAVSVSLAQAPRFASGVPKLAALYALAPYGAKFKPGARAKIANRGGLAAGSAVDLYALGTTSYTPNFARFYVAARARVSDDGASIVLDEGETLSELSWLGIAPRATP